jgi:DNA-binding LacI/PurR family transcriptional regulator
MVVRPSPGRSCDESVSTERWEASVERRPTLRSVAERAGVSQQTVSNVINAPHLVRPETIGRVSAVIDELGYRPHRAARQLRTRRSHIVGVRVLGSVDGIRGAVTERFLHAITEQAQEFGYRIMVFTAPDDDGEIQQYDDLLDTVDIDAFVLTDTHHGDARTRWLSDRGIPFVTFGRPWDEPDTDARPHPWIDVDGSAGTRAAVEHLLALGHRRIGFIGWPDGSDVGDDRRRGWQEAMRTLDLAPAELDALRETADDTVDNGAHAATRLVQRTAPTAFVCASDSLALGALAVTRTGSDLTAPASCAVVGFDDTPVAAAVGLSSVAQPLQEVARRSLLLLLDQLDGLDQTGEPVTAEPQDRQALLLPRLVVRASSTPPPATRDRGG